MSSFHSRTTTWKFATDGSASAPHFTGPRSHHQVANAGHNLPREAPAAFADAILEVTGLR